eukprot:UN1761
MVMERPPAKMARLQFNERHSGVGGSGFCAKEGEAGDAGPSGEMRRTLRTWAAERQPGQVPRAAAPSVEGTKSVLLEATQEMMTADRLGRLGHRTEKDGGPDPPREVVDAMARAKSLLQHFRASRQSEVAKRSKLVREMSALASTVGSWQEDSHGVGVGPRDGLRGDLFARRGARSFLSPLRRAIDGHKSLLT